MESTFWIMIVALIADVAVLLLILLYTAKRFPVTVVRKIYQLAERGQWGERPAFYYQISARIWTIEMLFIILFYAAAYSLFISIGVADVWVGLVRDTVTMILLIFAAYVTLVGPFFHWMLKKKLLMVPDGKSGSICFVNLGDFIVIRELVVALASCIRTFGFPDYLVRESDVHSSSSHSRLYC